ncbi:MAG: hypothetical protein PUC99_07575 [Eubacteriales bacterium]|jgi:hypothetical protein|nr:hypothetical protein [Lachnospiraceae bacterium]MDD5860179.1 hypothetical protein [Eubacteriales bacterium]MCI1334495.1 hypothetical protein [Lachnospiraceae bacterium]MCI1358734.1 hypothetical protein [Lachnospiraceae bacterium]MCI1379370.1 hypothetical protein [Lachnospiraceae bacterium]
MAEVRSAKSLGLFTSDDDDDPITLQQARRDANYLFSKYADELKNLKSEAGDLSEAEEAEDKKSE